MLNGDDDLGRTFSSSRLSVPLGEESATAWQRLRWNGAAIAVFIGALGGWTPLVGAIVLGGPWFFPAAGAVLTAAAMVTAVIGYRRRSGKYIFWANVVAVGWGLVTLALGGR